MITKLVQVNITKQFRSKATLTHNKGVHQSHLWINPGSIFVNFSLSQKKGFNNTNVISVDIKSKNFAKIIRLNTIYDNNDVYIDMTSFALIGG